jgi:hypothetical protein
MRLRLRSLVAAAVVSAAAMPAAARMSVYGPFLHDTSMPNVLILQGEITAGIVYDFRKALREHRISVVMLDSPGGSVYEGLELSAIIRDRALATLIPPDASCASACAFLFVAGVKRQAYGQLGVHQFASSGAGDPPAEGQTQHVAAEIIDFLKEYEIPLMFVVRMLETPNAEMYWFPEQELIDEGLVTGEPFDAEVAAWNALGRSRFADGDDGPSDTPGDTPGDTPDEKPAVTIVTTPGAGPSFDCAAATLATERTICRDRRLAALDAAMAEWFARSQSELGTTDAGIVRAEQIAWLTRRNGCGINIACIERSYTERIGAIQVRLGG